MAERGLSPGGPRAWTAMAITLGLVAVAAWRLPHALIDWQPTLALSQPWRAWSAVFVHYSTLHLAANLAGALLVGALGWAVPVPLRCTVAWLLAWPLTQAVLLAQPALLHYGGLSGVLHAGVAVVAVHLLFAGTRGQRRIGFAMAVVLCVKLASEAPWQGPLRRPAGWDIDVAALAHVAGVVCGAACAVLLEWRHGGVRPGLTQ